MRAEPVNDRLDERLAHFVRSSRPPSVIITQQGDTVTRPAGHLYLGSLLHPSTGGVDARCPAPRPLDSRNWRGASALETAQNYLKQCMAHVNEEYLVRARSPLQ